MEDVGPEIECRSNSLFRATGNVDLNACVGDNGGRYDLFDYAHGYFVATLKILEAAHLHEVNVAVDTLVYPACYNFRHSIELYVKYLTTSFAWFLADPGIRFEAKHGLQRNWAIALEAASAYGWSPFQEDEITLGSVSA